MEEKSPEIPIRKKQLQATKSGKIFRFRRQSNVWVKPFENEMYEFNCNHE